MSCAERRRRLVRFPLAIRAARTPDAPALVFRPDAVFTPHSSCATGGSSRIAGALPQTVNGSGAEPPCTMSFRELDLLTTAVAQGLRVRGVLPGERVGVLLPSGPAYPLLLLSLLRAGAVAVPVSTRLPGSTVPALLVRICCRRLIADDYEVRDAAAGIDVIDAAGLLAAPRENRPGGQLSEDLVSPQRLRDPQTSCIPSEGPPTPCPSPSMGRALVIPGAEPGATPAGTLLPEFDPGADATVIFTSGSTGTPKAALHTFENHWSSALGANRNIPLRPGDRWLLSLPPWHVGGLAIVFRCLLGGAAIAIKGRDEPLADAISALGATHVSLVATQLFRLLREKRGRAALSRLKAVLLGGGPAPAALIEDTLRAGVRIVTSYGSTEMSSQATASRPGDPPETLETAGRPLAFREIAIAADGEILMRGRTLFRGYIEETGISPARDAAGWFHSGDLGRLDADGRLSVMGRRDTMFISGGENIHPEEIEREILRFPGMLEAIVVPVPDPEFGARPVAFLRTSGGVLPASADLDQFLRQTLPGFKLPQRYLRWPEIEDGMKPDRRAFAGLARDTKNGDRFIFLD